MVSTRVRRILGRVQEILRRHLTEVQRLRVGELGHGAICDVVAGVSNMMEPRPAASTFLVGDLGDVT